MVIRKLKNLKSLLTDNYGKEHAHRIIKNITDDADRLAQFDSIGVNIADMYDIDTEYWYLFTNHQYLIYRITSDSIIVVQMFHEREDFMLQIFGVSGRTQESIDYWGE